jgi:hypothetical protein
MTNGVRRWLPLLITLIVGGVVAFVMPYVYPADRGNPTDLWAHPAAGIVFGLGLAALNTITRRLVART